MTPLQMLERLRPNYGKPLNGQPHGGVMTREENGALLNALCWAFRADGWGMYSKNDENSAIHPSGETISRDVLANKVMRIWVDCLIDAEGAGTPTWDEHADAEIAGWVAPIAPANDDPTPVPVLVPTPTPTPIPPTPQPPSVDLSPVIDRLNQIEDSMAHVLDVVLEQFGKVHAELQAERKITAKLSGFIGGNITGTIAKKD